MHLHLSSVAFHVRCVGLGCHVVIGVGLLIVRFHHAYVIPSFLLDVVVRLYLVIVNSDCSHNYCLLHIEETGHLRCCPYILRTLKITAAWLWVVLSVSCWCVLVWCVVVCLVCVGVVCCWCLVCVGLCVLVCVWWCLVVWCVCVGVCWCVWWCVWCGTLKTSV